MDLVKEMADYFIYLIPIAAGVRILHCIVRMNANQEEATMYLKRIKNTVIFSVFAVVIWELKDIALSYYQ